MHPVLKLAGSMDGTAALGRLKTQGQDFSRTYSEFVFYRDFALERPALAQKWIALNRMALASRKVLGSVNAQLDTANKIVEMMLGTSLTNIAPEYSNLYLMSGNAALAYVNQELMKFNSAVNNIVNFEAAQNDENQANPE